MDETLFELRFASKQLERSSKRCEKDQAKEKLKVKKALAKNNIEAAKIYAENAIRKKNEALNYLRLASRIDAVSSRLKISFETRDLTKTMGNVVKGLDKALSSMDLAKVSEIMEKFEQQSDTTQVHTDVMVDTIGDATTLSSPVSQVDSLIRQVAEENGLKIDEQLSELQPGTSQLQKTEENSAGKSDADLGRRLAALRN